MKKNIKEPTKVSGLGRYHCPEATEVEYVSSCIVCISPDTEIETITEPDEELGVWDD